MKEIKRLSVISTARQVRLLSRAELTELTGLSPATLTPLVRDLIAEGYLIERGPGASRAGRPRAMLEFNPRAELVAAVSLEPSRISCEIADSDGAVVAHRAVRLTGDIVDTICRSVPELAGDGLPALRGVAIAAPGVISGGAVRLAPSVGLIEGRPIGESVQRALGVPVVVDNDVNLMAAGEHAAGAGMDVADLLLLHVADGIGAGLVLDGQVRRVPGARPARWVSCRWTRPTGDTTGSARSRPAGRRTRSPSGWSRWPRAVAPTRRSARWSPWPPPTRAPPATSTSCCTPGRG